MTEGAMLQSYCDAVDRHKLYSSSGRLLSYLGSIFESVEFRGARVLDVGAGDGLCSFYAACMGAEKVVAVEPWAEGSDAAACEKFEKLAGALNLSRVDLCTTTLQDYDPGGEKFDVVILHQSINHLDEAACADLQRDSSAVETYRRLFRKIGDMMSVGGKLVITDCSRYNFFGLMGVGNPFAPAVEWHKHQSPYLWAALLCSAGFRDPKVGWISPNCLGRVGRALLGNKAAAFFLRSYFCLTVRKT